MANEDTYWLSAVVIGLPKPPGDGLVAGWRCIRQLIIRCKRRCFSTSLAQFHRDPASPCSSYLPVLYHAIIVLGYPIITTLLPPVW